jgi:hypothetical protein
MKLLFIIVLAIWGIIPAAIATEKPRVSVAVHITAKDFLKFHSNPELKSIEKNLAREIAAILNSRIPIFVFRSDAGEKDTLMIEVATEAGRQVKFMSIDLVFTLKGKNIRRECKTMEWKNFIRAGSFFRYTGSNQIAKLKNCFIKSYDESSLLGMLQHRWLVEHVESIAVTFNPPAWELPFTNDELPISHPTQLVIYQWHKEPVEKKIKTMERIFLAHVVNQFSGSKRIFAEGKNPSPTVVQFKTDNLSLMKKSTFLSVSGLQLVNVAFIKNYNKTIPPSKTQHP